MWPGQDIQRRWTWADIEAIRSARADGHTLQEIARSFGKSPARIWQLLKVAERRYGPNFDGRRISTRLKNCLELADCWTIDAAAQHTLQWWLEQPNFNTVCAIELAEILDHRLFHSDLGTLAQCLRTRNAAAKRRARA